MKSKKLLIALLIIVLILLFFGSLLMTLRSLFYNFVKDTTKEGMEFLEKYNYPFKEYEYVNKTRYLQ